MGSKKQRVCTGTASLVLSRGPTPSWPVTPTTRDAETTNTGSLALTVTLVHLALLSFLHPPFFSSPKPVLEHHHILLAYRRH